MTDTAHEVDPAEEWPPYSTFVQLVRDHTGEYEVVGFTRHVVFPVTAWGDATVTTLHELTRVAELAYNPTGGDDDPPTPYDAADPSPARVATDH